MASSASQSSYHGFPLMLSTAPMPAAWTLQPDLFVALVRDVCGLFALVVGGVPHAPDDVIIRVRQRPLPIRTTCIFAISQSLGAVQLL